jgi:hypothetical protein
MNTALEYSTIVVQEGGRRCKKSTLNDLAYLTPLRIRIPLMNPPHVAKTCSLFYWCDSSLGGVGVFRGALEGRADFLIWFDNHGVFQVKKARRESMALLSTRFGTGWMLAGRTVTDCGMWVTALWDHGGGGQYGGGGIQATGLYIGRNVGY